MGRTQHYAGLHLIKWSRFEPCYRWESMWPQKIEPKTSGHRKQGHEDGERATLRLAETVYERKSGRTATIMDVSGDLLTLVYDDDKSVKKYRKKEWIKNVPFKSAASFLPLYARVGNSQSCICVRFGNIIEPIWVEGYLVPFFLPEEASESVRMQEREALIIDEFNQNTARKGTKYELSMAVPKHCEDEDCWTEYYTACLEAFREKDVDYIAIPYVYDICRCEHRVDSVKIAFDVVTSWMEKNPDYAMQVVFLCTNVNIYDKYKAIVQKYAQEDD